MGFLLQWLRTSGTEITRYLAKLISFGLQQIWSATQNYLNYNLINPETLRYYTPMDVCI